MLISLQVEPFASLCTLLRFDVPRLLVNRELVGPFRHGRKRVTDVALTGDLVESVREIAAQAGWTAELQHLITIGDPKEVKEDNRKRVTDVALTGDLVESVREIAAQTGWTAELQHLITIGDPKEVTEDNTLVSNQLGQFSVCICSKVYLICVCRY